MKFKTIFISFVIPLIIISFISCSQQKTEWQGSIEEVDGVTVVKNPKEPMYGEDVCIIEEELSIGQAEGSEKYMFSGIREMVVDVNENIYVGDNKEMEIKVYDKFGRYLRTVGEEGQGPGEIGSLNGIQIVNDSKLMIHDEKNRRLHYFSLNGKFLGAKKFGTLWHLDLLSDSDKIYYSVVSLKDPPNSRIELMRLDSELNKIETIGTMHMSDSPLSLKFFIPEIDFKIMHDNCLLYGYPEKDYELQIFSREGKLLKKIIKKFDPVLVSDKEKQKEMKNIKKMAQGIYVNDRMFKFESHHPAYSKFVTDDKCWIFVRTWKIPNDEEGVIYDVFDAEGRFLAELELDFIPIVWNKDRIYTKEEDEEGYQYVKRYKVNWKI